ncbi:MAG: lysylphosphatidylglycerol synthase domain-containing protein [Chloroflexota bacterium]|jgi:hypothetical protein
MTADSTTARRRKIFRLLKLVFGLSIIIFWGILVRHYWDELLVREWSLDRGLAGVVTLAFCVYHLGLAIGWAFIVKAMGYRSPASRASAIWLLSMPARYIPGNLWHIVTRVRMSAGHKIPAEGVLASSTVEQALTVLSATFLGLAWLPILADDWWTGWTFAFLLACLFILQPPVLQYMLRLASRLLGKPMAPFTLDYRHIISIFLWYTLVNAANGAAFAFLVAATTPVSQAQLPWLVSAYCLAYVIGYVSFLTPSGIGVREVALASMMALYMPMSLALTFGLIARLLSIAGEALAVLLVGLPLSWRPRLGL